MTNDDSFKRELKKQMIDQPLHFLWMFATFAPLAIGIRGGLKLLIVVGLVLVFCSAGYAIGREIDQWPSKRWWDPYLDWTFFVFGAAFPFFIWR